MRVVDRRVDDPRLLYQWSKISSRTALLLALVVVGTVWFEGLRSLGTFLGLLSAGMAIALKDVVTSLAGWVFILWRRPFQSGTASRSGPGPETWWTSGSSSSHCWRSETG
jgi:small-conductance mechanosensitive channel